MIVLQRADFKGGNIHLLHFSGRRQATALYLSLFMSVDSEDSSDLLRPFSSSPLPHNYHTAGLSNPHHTKGFIFHVNDLGSGSEVLSPTHKPLPLQRFGFLQVVTNTKILVTFLQVELILQEAGKKMTVFKF